MSEDPSTYDDLLGQQIHTAAVAKMVEYLRRMNPETVKEAISIYNSQNK